MKTDDLIKNLAEKAEPVKRLKRPEVRAVLWLPIAIFCMGITLPYLGGLRYDVEDIICTPGFIIENIAIVLAAVTSTIAAFRLSLPNVEVSRNIKILLGITTLVWVGLCIKAILGMTTTDLEHEIAGHHGFIHCLSDTLLLAGIPVLALLLMIRRAAPTHFSLTGYASLMAVLSFAALGSRYMCSIDSGAHLFMWHFFPVILIGLIGLVAGRFIFRW